MKCSCILFKWINNTGNRLGLLFTKKLHKELSNCVKQFDYVDMIFLLVILTKIECLLLLYLLAFRKFKKSKNSVFFYLKFLRYGKLLFLEELLLIGGDSVRKWVQNFQSGRFLCVEQKVLRVGDKLKMLNLWYSLTISWKIIIYLTLLKNSYGFSRCLFYSIQIEAVCCWEVAVKMRVCLDAW